MYSSAKEYVGAIDRLFDKSPPLMHAFVATHGREFELKLTPDSGIDTLGKCYRNATTLCIRKGYEYVEGWATPRGLMPMEHAWCYDPVDQRIIDPTWKDGISYFGVVMDLRAVCALSLEYGYHGVGGNLIRMRQKPQAAMERLESLLWRPPVPIGQQLSFEDKVY